MSTRVRVQGKSKSTGITSKSAAKVTPSVVSGGKGCQPLSVGEPATSSSAGLTSKSAAKVKPSVVRGGKGCQPPSVGDQATSSSAGLTSKSAAKVTPSVVSGGNGCQPLSVGEPATSSSAGLISNPAAEVTPSVLSGGEGCQPQEFSDSDSDDGEEDSEQETRSKEEHYMSDFLKPGLRSRYARAHPVDFKIVNRTCLKGGWLKKPVILETSTFEGTEMMKVTGRENWLCQAGTGQVIRRGSFETGVCRVRELIGPAIAKAVHTVHAKKIAAASSGRDLLNIQDSSESSDDWEEDKKAKKKESNKRKVESAGLQRVHDIQFNGVDFKALKLGKKLFVEARADVAKTIVEACLEATFKVVLEETSREVDGPSAPRQLTVREDQVLEGSRVDNHSGKSIHFNSGKSQYEIRYKDEEGVLRRSIKGLEVRFRNRKGKNLPVDEYQALMHRVHTKAKRMWNEQDKSLRTRFELQ